jgi:uncharacterized protein YbaR (Trm112 family)
VPIAAKRSQLIRFKRTKQRGQLAVHARTTKAMTISRSLPGNAYMLIETPKLNDAGPPAWLTDVLACIAKNRVYRIDERLPRCYAEASA